MPIEIGICKFGDGLKRAKMRVLVRRILKKHGYPTDLAEAATQTVLEQAEVLCAEWAVN